LGRVHFSVLAPSESTTFEVASTAAMSVRFQTSKVPPPANGTVTGNSDLVTVNVANGGTCSVQASAIG